MGLAALIVILVVIIAQFIPSKKVATPPLSSQISAEDKLAEAVEKMKAGERFMNDELSEKIRAEIAFVEGNVVTRFTNNQENLYYLPYLSRVSRELKEKNNFEHLAVFHR